MPRMNILKSLGTSLYRIAQWQLPSAPSDSASMPYPHPDGLFSHYEQTYSKLSNKKRPQFLEVLNLSSPVYNYNCTDL